MFKGFQDTNRSPLFRGFPNLNFQMNNEAFGFSGWNLLLDAAHGLNTQTNLDSISKWVDKINGIGFNQTTAGNQPRLVVSDANFNNNPSVDFQSAARFLSSSTTIGSASNCAFVFVFKVNAINANNNILLNLNNSTANFYGYGGGNAGINGLGYFTGVSNVVLQGTSESTTEHIGIIKSGSDGIIMVDGNVEATGALVAPGSFTDIGHSARGINGQIAMMGLINRNFSSTELQELSSNINTKYAIY